MKYYLRLIANANGDEQESRIKADDLKEAMIWTEKFLHDSKDAKAEYCYTVEVSNHPHPEDL